MAERLREYGFDQVVEGVGRTGVVGVLKGRQGDGSHSVGLRGDMDALPLQEVVDAKNTKGYESKTPGVRHACGHDGHTTILLGAAKYLSAHRMEFAGTINVIFQPAEEGLADANAMMEDGLFERFPCDEIYGLHNRPKLGLGKVNAFPCPRMAAADRFNITVKGVGGHGAYPHLSKDPVVGAAQMIMSLQTVVSRSVSPMDAVFFPSHRWKGAKPRMSSQIKPA